MSNKLIKYDKIHKYVYGEEAKLRYRFAFMCDWARKNMLNFTRDQKQHTITFRFPTLKVHYIFHFVTEIPEGINALTDTVHVCESASSFIETAINTMEEELGIA